MYGRNLDHLQEDVVRPIRGYYQAVIHRDEESLRKSNDIEASSLFTQPDVFIDLPESLAENIHL